MRKTNSKERGTFKNVILQIQSDEAPWKSCLQLHKNIENNQLITDCRCNAGSLKATSITNSWNQFFLNGIRVCCGSASSNIPDTQICITDQKHVAVTARMWSQWYEYIIYMYYLNRFIWEHEYISILCQTRSSCCCYLSDLLMWTVTWALF